MVKFCIDKYPMGSFKGQRTPGKYMDGYLYDNLNILAEKISQDMTFLGIIYSSTLEVGTGKTVLATQIGEAWTEIIKQKYNIDLPYDVNNIVFKPQDLIDKAKTLPKYSFILLDEWEDSNYWSEIGMSLRQFFRKCRQLNLFIICIIPNWFQLPLSYAISRSIFAIDVRFDDNLDRGIFAFYSFKHKRMLYMLGKKNHNYEVVNPTFKGRFTDGYGVDDKEYRKVKLNDMLEYDKQHPEKKTRLEIQMEINAKVLKNIIKMFPKFTNEELKNIFGVSKNTIIRWKRGDVSLETPLENSYTNNPIDDNDNEKMIEVNEEALERFEKERGSDYNIGDDDGSEVNQ